MNWNGTVDFQCLRFNSHFCGLVATDRQANMRVGHKLPVYGLTCRGAICAK
jgi:hypothetical protein